MNITIPAKSTKNSLDCLDFCAQRKDVNSPAHFVREISTIQTIFCDSIDGVYPLESARILMKNVLHNNAIST